MVRLVVRARPPGGGDGRRRAARPHHGSHGAVARDRARRHPRLAVRQPVPPAELAAAPGARRPAGHRRRVGRRHRGHQPHLSPQAVPQAPRHAAVPRVPAPVSRASGRRRTAVTGPGNPLVQPHGRGPPRPQAQGRRWNPDREPDPRPGVCRVPGSPRRREWRRRPRAGPRCLARTFRDPGGRAVPDAGARRHARSSARTDAQGLRRQCLARAALAAHRDLRLPRRAGGGGGHRRGMAGTGRRHAPPGAAHARDRGRPARAFAARVDGRRGANGAGGRARAHRAPCERGRSVRGGHARDSSFTSIRGACCAAAKPRSTRSRRT